LAWFTDYLVFCLAAVFSIVSGTALAAGFTTPAASAVPLTIEWACSEIPPNH